MTEAFMHPETGEILSTREALVSAIAEVEEQMQPYWKTRRTLREALAEFYPAPELPRPRERTVIQEKVARCPRCGGRLDADAAGE